MNKKLMAVAVAGAFGAVAAPTVALAQSSTVQMFGTINLIYGYYDNGQNGISSTQATAGIGNPAAGKLRYDAMNESESEIGVKGEEALGGGTSAWFQCLSSFDVTGNRGANGSGGWCGRNSAFGMKGGFGNAFVGNWDTPTKVVMSNYRVFALSYPMGIGMMYNGASSDVGNANANSGTVVSGAGGSASMGSQFIAVGGGASFSRRQTRLFSYVTPVMSGFQGSVAFSAANETSAQTSASTAQKPRLWSMGLNYTNGPLGLGFGYEKHVGYNAFAVTSAGSGAAFTEGTDSSYQLGAGYTFMGGALRVNALWARLKYNQTISTIGSTDQNLQQTNWNLNGEWKVSGPHSVRLGYTKNGTSTGTVGTTAAPVMIGGILGNGGAGNTGAQKYSFEYAYAMSKRTELSLGYAKVNNDSSSNQSVGTGSTAPGFGESQSYIGLRAKHSF